jgi:SAM-dependent methyltransferase
MNILKNSDIAKKYNVSSSTVGLWIKYALTSKNNLQLEEKNKKYYILDNQHNEAEMNRITEKNKKYRSNIACKRTKASDEFYKFFQEEEIAEIVSDLEFKRQAKAKYSYKLAEWWDIFYKESQSPVTNVVNEMLFGIEDVIDYLTKNSKSVNIVDIGPGNGQPVKKILEFYHNKKKINKYVTIDISQEMNELATSNGKKWFPGLQTESYERDLEASRIGKILLQSKSLQRDITNVIFHLGGTIDNHDDRTLVLKNMRNGMVDNDMLVFNFSLETDFHRGSLNYIRSSNADLSHTWVLSMLGIDADKCKIHMEYDSVRKCKAKVLKLDKDYIVEVKLFNQKREIEFFKNEPITIWRHHLISLETLMKEIKQADLKLAYLKLDKELNSAIAICKL